MAVAKRVKVNSLAGTVRKQDGGRLHIAFRGKRYLAHRLAWLFVYGKWPEGVIDHLNGNSLDNRISNLRDVSNTVNSQNQRKSRSDNQAGFLGVSWHSRTRKFLAQIQINGVKTHLGLFTTPEEAHAAYLAAKRKYHEGCTI